MYFENLKVMIELFHFIAQLCIIIVFWMNQLPNINLVVTQESRSNSSTYFITVAILFK